MPLTRTQLEALAAARAALHTLIEQNVISDDEYDDTITVLYHQAGFGSWGDATDALADL